MRQKGSAKIIIIILLLILIGLVAYFGFRQTKITSVSTGSNISISSPTPTPTADPTANWKTYIKDFSDPQNLYPSAEIKYPPDWKYTRESSEGTADQHILFTDTNGKDTIDLTFSALDFVTDDYDIQPQEFGQLNEINVDGNLAYHFQNLFDNHYIDSYFFPLQKQGYVALSLTNANYPSVFAQILSTFKFIFPPQPSATPIGTCITNSDCPTGEKCLGSGPIIQNQPEQKVCISSDKVVPL